MFSAPTAEVTKLAEVYFNHASWQLTQEDGQLAIADVTFTNFRYSLSLHAFWSDRLPVIIKVNPELAISEFQKLSRSKRGEAQNLSCQNGFYYIRIGRYRVARVAGGTWVGVLYCFGGGAEGRVGIKVNLKFPRGFTTRFAWRLRRHKRAQGTRIPPATQANFRATRRFRFKVRLSVLPWIWTWIFILMDVKFIFTRKVLRHSLLLKLRVFGTRKWLCS